MSDHINWLPRVGISYENRASMENIYKGNSLFYSNIAEAGWESSPRFCLELVKSQFLKSEHELLIIIIQLQLPFIENLLCTRNKAKSFKFRITRNPHNNSMSYVWQFVSGNQEANQFDSKTSTHKYKGVHFRSRLCRDQSLWLLGALSS